jgi:dynein heavy chain
MVPTTDTVKFSHSFQELLQMQKPILITGNTGVGKSIVVQNLLVELKSRLNINSVMVNFSAQTTPQ